MKKFIMCLFAGIAALGPLACRHGSPSVPSLPTPTAAPTGTFTPGCQVVSSLIPVTIPQPSYLNGTFPNGGQIVIGTSPTPTSTFTPVPTITPVVDMEHPHSFTVIRSPADWSDYCVSATGSTTVPTPPVDFTRQMIIADYLCMGYCNPTRLALTSLCWQPGLIVVNEMVSFGCPIECAAPPPWLEFQCNPDGFAYAVPQSNLPVQFVVNEQNTCPGYPTLVPTPTVTVVP